MEQSVKELGAETAALRMQGGIEGSAISTCSYPTSN